MHAVVSVNPFRCRMWSLHDRLESVITEESCRAEIDSFSKHGQFVPVLGRPLRGDPLHEVELIYGARRLFVACHINKPLVVELREGMSDRDALVAMDVENRQRVDISAYERGQSYARWLREGHFRSQDDIARALKVSPSQVSRLLKIARLPTVVVSAFNSPVDICEGWGLDLIVALNDPLRREQTIRRARAVGAAGIRPAAAEIYRQLLGASLQGRKVRPKACDEIVKDGRGAPLFRIRHQTHSIAIVLPLERVSEKSLEKIRWSLRCLLQGTSGQPVDTQEKTAVSPASEVVPLAAYR